VSNGLPDADAVRLVEVRTRLQELTTMNEESEFDKYIAEQRRKYEEVLDISDYWERKRVCDKILVELDVIERQILEKETAMIIAEFEVK
jgi:hypothetical protein